MKLKFLTALAILTISLQASADQSLSAVPTAWRLQNYANDGLVAYFSGSSCASGQISINTTAGDRNRFYATILAAKLTKANVFVYYNDTIAGCPITSFGMDTP